MTALFSARRRAEEFHAAVEAPDREVSEELAPLVQLAGELRGRAASDDPAVPRAEFAADLRARLMAEAVEVMTPGSALVLPTRPRGRREQRLVAAAAAAVLLGGTAGVAAASQDALPGDALYPVKRGIERAEAGLSMSSAGKGRDLLHQASGRLEEVRALLTDGSVTQRPRVPQALGDFTAQAEQGAALLLDSYQENRDPDSVVAVREFTARSIAEMRDVARAAPPEAQEDLTAAALALREIDVRASALCPSCASDLPVLEVPGVLLVASEAGRTLREVDPGRLDNSHPFLAPKGLLPGKDGGTRDDGTAGGTGDLTDGVTDGGVTGGDPQGTPQAPAPGSSLLPGQDSDVSEQTEQQQKRLADTTEELTDTVGDTVGQITDGLDGAVETLLPDPQPGSLLP